MDRQKQHQIARHCLSISPPIAMYNEKRKRLAELVKPCTPTTFSLLESKWTSFSKVGRVSQNSCLCRQESFGVGLQLGSARRSDHTANYGTRLCNHCRSTAVCYGSRLAEGQSSNCCRGMQRSCPQPEKKRVAAFTIKQWSVPARPSHAR